MEYNHFSQLIHLHAEKFGDEEALRFQDQVSGTWTSVSWDQFSKTVMGVARSLSHTGVKPHSKIGVYTNNAVECFYIDFGAFSNRAAVVPMYATASVPQIAYIINDAEIKLLFVGGQSQYDNAWEVAKQVETPLQIVVLEKQVTLAPGDKTSMYFDFFSSAKNRSSQDMIVVDRHLREAESDDIAHIIYTSGTTGEPKGVVLTHNNYVEAMKIHDARLSYLPKRFLSVSFLPLAHIFEKAWSVFCLHRASTIAINADPREITTTIKVVKPQALCSVPRFWEKVYAGVQEKIESSGFLLKKIFLDAISTGKKYNLDCINQGKKPSLFLKLRFLFYAKTVYALLKKTVGIENGLIFPCAGAVLSEEIITFLRSVDIPLVYGYGLTETTATISCYPKLGFEQGTVGQVMPGLSVRIGENNEIQVKGESIMKEYYKKPEATAEVFTEDGWFRTGDAGDLTENMGIIMTERIKDLYKTSNGKYIAPQQLEARLVNDKYVDSAIIIADRRKYVSALIIPEFTELLKYAEEKRIPFEKPEDLCKNPDIIHLYQARIEPIQKELAGFEQIKQFTLLPEPFSIHTGELTNTLKMRRQYIAEKFKAEIEKMYVETGD
ncbi:MAG: long-chain fatty acid--CoA ligase [Dysgonamonadaceae bacterium]|jgi:long-chain acyl-CoA synthetase|nr:long-chain fatty acid--CoA ligase [Dysgonamonadaceae bacterium]